MTVSAIPTLQPGIHAGSAPGFSLQAGDDFADKLQLGQIIKGRVLRQYEGQRYAVDFGGREKVVDSAVPLKTGEILYGRVVGLGAQVELERVRGAPAPVATQQQGMTPTGAGQRLDDAARLVTDLFEQYQARLSPHAAMVIDQAVRKVAEPAKMAMAALLLHKLGIVVTPEWLKAVYDILRVKSGQGIFPLSGDAIALQIDAANTRGANDQAPEELILALADALQAGAEHLPVDADPPMDDHPVESGHAEDRGLPSGSSEDQGKSARQQPDLARLLWNIQTGGSIEHRVNTIPLLVNDRLVELDVAMFEQREQARDGDAIRHRQLCFSLKTEGLGQVEGNLTLAGSHVKMRIAADREQAADQLAAYSAELMAQISNEGWIVDALQYEVSTMHSGGVKQVVLQHVINQDSVSKLI